MKSRLGPMDPWDVPAYTAAEAGRMVGLRPERIRRWLQGYEYNYHATGDASDRRIRQEPVIHRGGNDAPYATFLDLIDLLFVKKFLDQHISLQKLRRALTEADALIGGHHFAQRSFFTDGRNIYLQVKDHAGALLELLSGGQWVIAPVIKQLATEIRFHRGTGFAEQWYPLGPSSHVVIDPRIAFGAPSLVSRGVKTANVFDFYLAERKRVDVVCDWMELEKDEVNDAIRFEEQLAAA
jgi:uncharacterized protein (DUF433 family)